MVKELQKKYEAKMKILRDDLELRRKVGLSPNPNPSSSSTPNPSPKTLSCGERWTPNPSPNCSPNLNKPP